MSICVIFNPVARGEKAARFRAQIARFGREVAFRPTTGPGGGRPLAEEAARAGFDTVVAAGGDGTLNEVVNGLADAPGGLARTRLGVLPLGTVNVFAKELALPERLSEAWEVLLAGHTRAFDVAVAELTVEGRPTRRLFVQLAGAGLDARAVELVDWEHKKRVGKLAYVVAGLRALREPQPRIQVTADGAHAEGELVLLGNGRFYGGRYVLFPRANPCDGLLDVTVFPRVDWRVVLRMGWRALVGASPAAGGAVCLQARAVELSSAGPVPIQLEGDCAGHLPARCSVLPGALQVVCPAPARSGPA